MAAQNPEASPGRFVCISVTDTGCGMTPEIQSRIFEPFFTTKEAGKGTGLGLATVFGIVKQHKGWVKVDSEVGKGTTFRIFIPALAASADALPKEATRIEPRGGSETVLLVEDDDSMRKLSGMALENNGYQVVEAANGDEAVQIWPEHHGRIALLLTDLVLPGSVNGLDLGNRLQAQKPELKVIFTSGYSAAIAGRELKLNARQRFIQKPFQSDQLLNNVRDLLDS
jgi:two-component system cell cycle sensor histidine kinase/response regulator CckA